MLLVLNCLKYHNASKQVHKVGNEDESCPRRNQGVSPRIAKSDFVNDCHVSQLDGGLSYLPDDTRYHKTGSIEACLIMRGVR